MTKDPDKQPPKPDSTSRGELRALLARVLAPHIRAEKQLAAAVDAVVDQVAQTEYEHSDVETTALGQAGREFLHTRLVVASFVVDTHTHVRPLCGTCGRLP